MKTEEILKIVEESFANNIYTFAFEGILGLESGVDESSKKDFLTEIKEKLEASNK